MAVSSLYGIAALALSAQLVFAAPNPYVPVLADCPAGSLLRPANGVGNAESAFLKDRATYTDKNLRNYLGNIYSNFSHVQQLPKLAAAYSGGSYRALLAGAGFRQALDSRDSKSSVAGIYQALTYEAALSGGSWMLGSISGSGYPTISKQRDDVWEPNFQNGLLAPNGLLAGAAYAQIKADVLAKQLAGFDTTIVDLWGRLQGYSFLSKNGEDDGGVSKLFSDIATASNVSSANVPLPILTSLGVFDDPSYCASTNSTQFEFTPYEFGSWDPSVKSFTQTKYLGTRLENGKTNGSCVERYDNLGFVTGTSSNIFPVIRCSLDALTSTFTDILNKLEKDLKIDIRNTTDDVTYAVYPNPFYKLNNVETAYASQKQLYLADGGIGDENVPIWPLLHRDVDVIFANDNSDDANNYPNGSEVYNTYVRARELGLTRMPVIPTADTFVAKGLNKRPTFFGCNTNSTLTLLYFPNVNYTTNSGVSTEQLQFSPQQTAALIENGNHVADYNGTSGFATCVACAMMKKFTTGLPKDCKGCFDQYCYN